MDFRFPLNLSPIAPRQFGAPQQHFTLGPNSTYLHKNIVLHFGAPYKTPICSEDIPFTMPAHKKTRLIESPWLGETFLDCRKD